MFRYQMTLSLLSSALLGLVGGCGSSSSTTLTSTTVLPNTTETSLIVNGQPVTSRYPYMVGLKDASRSNLPFCGGTLIDSNSVLTAAHCAAPPAYLDFNPTITVLIDAIDPAASDPSQLIPIKEKLLIPAWRNDKLPPVLSVLLTAFDVYAGADVAILQLDPQTPEQVERLNSLPTVRLPDPSWFAFKPAATGKAIGWGLLANEGQQPEILQEVELPLLSQQDCREIVPFAPIGPGVLCAGNQPRHALEPIEPSELIGVCNGDSGGPLLSGDTQVGITSFVLGLPPGCARQLGYSGFVRLSYTPINQFVRDAAAANGSVATLDE